MAYEHLDVHLVNALIDNGRASLRSIAEDLDVSVTTVSNRLEELESRGVIHGFTPKVDYDQLGFDVTAVIQLKVRGDAIGEVSRQLETENRMISVYEVTGDFDIIAIGKYRDTDDMNDQIKELLGHEAIIETNTSIVLNRIAEHDQPIVPIES